MPNQYSFIEFSPREFEFLCRDLIQRKITEETGKPFFFNNFSEGADEGIDAIFKDEKQTIILQCKRYTNFINLYSTLKYSELPKVIKLNPTRYIIATSCKLSRKEIVKIFELFKSYTHNITDVVGQAMINNLLAAYPDIELNYPRLYLNSGAVLNRLLQANVYNQSIDKLKQYQNISKFYVNDGSFQKVLKILNEKKYVIISGEPGVGKSTLAGMLSLYYVNQGYEFIFIRNSVSEGEGSIWNEQKKQLFFFDDFLGSIAFVGFGINEDRRLLDFIRKIVESSNKLLLVTTREYVFKQAEAIYPELKKLQFTKCIIRQTEFTAAFKINVLCNYLYYSKIELKDIESLLYDEQYKGIVYHNNFTPRLISYYIEHYYDGNDNDYSLYFDLKRYLDDPYTYWEEIFLKLNNNTQMLLLIIAITEEPAIEELIRETFINVGKYRKIYEQGYEVDSFNKALAELSESFISISHNPDVKKEDGYISTMDYSLIFTPFRASKYLEFQNPSIKDFAINYLRKREDLIAILLRGATFFNQLIHVFATLDGDKYIEDYDTIHPFTVGKIILPLHLCVILAERMINAFDTLPVARVRRIDWSSGNTSYHLNVDQYDNKMNKLWLLCHYFPLNKYKKVQEFAIEKYKQLIKEDKIVKQEPEFENDYNPLSLEERLSQIDLIHKLHPFLQFDPLQTVKEYYHNIRFAKEFILLHYLREIFPDAYCKIVTTNIKEVRRKIKELIYDDIDHYLWEGTQEAEEAIDELLDMDLEQLQEIYKFSISKKLMQDINDMSGRELFRIDRIKRKSDNLTHEQENKSKDEAQETRELSKQKYKEYELALLRLVPHWDENWSEETISQYIQTRVNNIKISELLTNRIANNEYYEDFLSNEKSIDLLLDYLCDHEENPDSEFVLYEQILITTQFSDIHLEYLQKAAYDLYVNDLFVFRKESFENHRLKNGTDSIEPISINLYNAILSQQDIWFKFLNRTFHVFLAARHIMSLSEKERIEIYKSFEKDDVHYENYEILWKFCYKADKNLFCAYFILPLIQTEVNTIFKKDKDEMAINFLKEYDFNYEFDFWKEEQRFELQSASGGNALLEDISNTFEEWSIPQPFELIEDCFNISQITNVTVKRYMEKHCPVVEGKYEINIFRELANKEFRKLLKPAGVTKAIVEYMNTLKSLLNKFQVK